MKLDFEALRGLKLCVMYVRVSSDDQRDGFSIPAQIELLVNYAKAHDLKIIRIFEESMSAKDSGRVEFNRMLKYLKNHPEVRTILVEKTDRLYRNFKDYATIDDSKYEVHLVKENEILSKDSTSHQKLIHGLKVLLAKNFIDNLREETYKGRRKKAMEGYIVSGAPYGYKKINKNEVEIIADEAKFVQEAYKMYLKKKSLAKVREGMFKKGYVYKEDMPTISRGYLHRMLTNLYYTATIPFEGEEFPGKYEAIIERDTYNKVQILLRKEREYLREYIYGGIIRCERCGSMITVETQKEKYIYYHCTGGGRKCRQKRIHLSEDYVTRAFQRAMDKIEVSAEKRRWLEKNLKTEMNYVRIIDAADKDVIEKELEIINKAMDTLYDDKLSGKITEEYWQRRNQAFVEQAAAVQSKINSMSITQRGNFHECIKKLDEIDLIKEMFKKGGYNIQKELAKLVFSKVTLKGRILKFQYAYPFSYFLKEVEDEVDDGTDKYYD